MPLAVRPDFIEFASFADGAVEPNEEMVADGAETTLPVPPGHVGHGEVSSTARGRAMYDYFINFSHDLDVLSL